MVAARAPERDDTLELVVVRFEFVVSRFAVSVDTDPERDRRLVFVFQRDFERILMFVSSVVRRSKMVLKILEKAPCILERSGAESNCIFPGLLLSVFPDFISRVFIYCFQSSIQEVLGL